MGWRAVYTEARAERRATEELEGAGIRAVCLFERVTERTRVRRRHNVYTVRTADRPLWPRYVFAREEACVRRTSEARGVVGVVRVGGTPLVIPDRAFDVWLGRAQSAARLDGEGEVFGLIDERDLSKVSATFRAKVGDVFRVGGASPFAGLEAQLEDVRDLDTRGVVRALVTIFGRATLAEFDHRDVGAVLPKKRCALAKAA